MRSILAKECPTIFVELRVGVPSERNRIPPVLEFRCHTASHSVPSIALSRVHV